MRLWQPARNINIFSILKKADSFLFNSILLRMKGSKLANLTLDQLYLSETSRLDMKIEEAKCHKPKPVFHISAELISFLFI